MKKILTLFLALIVFTTSFCSTAFADENNVTIYTTDGRTASVSADQAEAYKKVGWYVAYNNMATIYSKNGSVVSIPVQEVSSYLNLNWYLAPDNHVKIYTWDGKIASIPVNEIEAYVNVGWNVAYGDKVRIYSPGHSAYIPIDQLSTYLNLGWYLYQVTTMYAADGRTTVVADNDIEAYKAVGWYSEPVTTMYSSDNRTIVIPTSEVEAYKNVGWFLEPQYDAYLYYPRDVIYERVPRFDLAVGGTFIKETAPSGYGKKESSTYWYKTDFSKVQEYEKLLKQYGWTYEKSDTKYETKIKNNTIKQVAKYFGINYSKGDVSLTLLYFLSGDRLAINYRIY